MITVRGKPVATLGPYRDNTPRWMRVLVTHDPAIAATAERRVELCDGLILRDQWEKAA